VAATGVGDFDEGIRFIQAIEAANPDDPRVLAQLVFCFASSNRLDEAEAKLAQMPPAVDRHASGKERDEWNVVMEADRGLIAFRRGLFADGNHHYEQAIRSATSHGLRETAAAALLYYAREIARADPNHGLKALSDARAVLVAFHESIRHVYEQVIVRAEQRLRK
jgi:hypothetical protein